MDPVAEVSRLAVLRYVLAVVFSKLDEPPFDPYAQDDFDAMLELLPFYHDAPRNSPRHLYAALADEDLVWRRMEIPIGRLVRGPGSDGLETELVLGAEYFVERFVRQVLDHHVQEVAFTSYFREGPIRHQLIPCTLVDYRESMPRLRGEPADYGPVYRIHDGFHRAFQLIARGWTTIPAYAASRRDGSPWSGYYGHLERWKDGVGWIPRQHSGSADVIKRPSES